MKKQKFNGTLRLKKSVISDLNASRINGGSFVFSEVGNCTYDPTEISCPNETEICTFNCPPPGPTQHIDCNTGPEFCATELSYCCL